MTRSRFDEELDNLQKSMEDIGKLCQEAILEATNTLFTGDYHEAEDSVNLHRRIHKSERKIEDSCLRLLMEQQPVATDLRVISSSLKAVYDLERIGEISADIAELVLNEHLSIANDQLNLKSMVQTSTSMVDDAREILINNFSKDGNPEYLINLMMVAKYLEKIGDHAVNVAKWTKFVATGKAGR